MEGSSTIPQASSSTLTNSGLSSTGRLPVKPTVVPLITLVCRFVPHDQWLLTHVGPYWKVKNVKHHVLGKCLNLSYAPPDPPPLFSVAEVQRPPSPITFAPHPKDRPISPILFASTKSKPPIVDSEEDEDLRTLDDFDDDPDGQGTQFPSDIEALPESRFRATDKGKQREFDPPYGVDNTGLQEGATIDGGRVLPISKASVASGSAYRPGQHPYHPMPQKSLPSQSASQSSYSFLKGTIATRLGSANASKPPDPKAVPELAHLSFALVRFSTGQILEDEYPISDYDLGPHELLELHLCIFPPSPEHPSAAGVLPPTPIFPFPLFTASSQLLKSKSKRKNARLALIPHQPSRLVQLPRTIPQTYVLPYWEGWIRILRYVCRDDDDYLYGGGYSVPPSGDFGLGSPKSKGRGIPWYAQSGDPYDQLFGLAGADIMGELREVDVETELSMNFGFTGFGKSDRARGGDKGKDQRSSTHPQGMRSRSRFEWRERWLVIRDGWMFLLKDCDDSKPTHKFPLGNLVTLRDADQLTESIDNVKGRRSRHEERHSRDHNTLQQAEVTHTVKEREKDTVLGEEYTVASPSNVNKAPASPLQSGYGHGRHRFGQQVSPKSPTHQEADAYDEDDEGDGRNADTRRYEKKSSTHRPHTHHHYHQSHRPPPQARRPPQSRHRSNELRPNLADPAVRARLNPRNFIPNSKEEADLVGMRIVCAKFLHPLPSEQSPVPDPFSGMPLQGEKISEGRKYTSTGPSLADVAASFTSSAGLLNLSIGELDWEREKEREEGREAERDKGRERDRAAQQARHKSRLHSKGSAPSALQGTAFPPSQTTALLNHAADRRPSLPVIPPGGTYSTPYEGPTKLPNPSSPNLHTSASSAALSFASLFGSPRDKENRRKEKERKEKEKEAKKQAKKEKKLEKEMDNDIGVGSNSSWRLGLSKKSKSKDMKLDKSSMEQLAAVVDSPAPASPALFDERLAATNVSSSDEDAKVYDRREQDPDDSSIGSPKESGYEPTFVSTHPDSSSVAAPRLEPEPAPTVSNSAPARVDAVDNESSSDSSSLALSSPVFARESDSDMVESDLDIDLGLRRRRTGYRYQGYCKDDTPKPTSEGLPDPRKQSLEQSEGPSITDSERNEAIPPPPHPVHPSAPGTRPKDGNSRARVQNLGEGNAKRKTPERRKGEWIIMDLGSDPAYQSLLRVLHRHIDQPISTSFVSAVSDIHSSVATPASASPNAMASFSGPEHHRFGNTLGASRRSNSVVGLTLNSPTSTLRNRSRSDAGQFTSPPARQLSGDSDDDDNDDGASRTSPKFLLDWAKTAHPPKLDSLVKSHQTRPYHHSIERTLGSLPYPEWRVEAVQRAKRAGLGVVGRPLEVMLMTMTEDSYGSYELEDPAFAPRSRSKASNLSKVGPPNQRDDRDEEEIVRSSSEQEDEEDELDEDDDGFIYEVSDSDEDEEEESETEWQAWMADLPRQIRLRRVQRSLANAPKHTATPDDGDDADEVEEVPTSLEAERLMKMQCMRNLEPCGVITSLYTSTALPGFVVPETGRYDHHETEQHRRHHRLHRNYLSATASHATLSSPSSSESLAFRRHASRGTTFGPLSVNTSGPNSTTSTAPPSAISHHHGHSQSFSQAPPSSSRPLHATRHSLLHHSASMQTDLRIPSDTSVPTQEAPTRRPSMPTLTGGTTTTTTEQAFALTPSSSGMVIRELKGEDIAPSSFGSYDPQPPVPDQRDNGVPGSPVSQHYAPSTTSLLSGSPSFSSPLRHQSSTGFSPGSIGRSSNLLKPNLLKKKESNLELERGRKWISEAMASPKLTTRPKLTVATSSSSTANVVDTGLGNSQNSVKSPTQVKSPSSCIPARSILGRVRSGSSVKSGDEDLTSPTRDGAVKKAGPFQKLVRGIDSALF